MRITCRPTARTLLTPAAPNGFLFGNRLSNCGTRRADALRWGVSGGISLAHSTCMDVIARQARSEEMAGLLHWLNKGLRRGETHRLEREFPDVLDPPDCKRHAVLEIDGEIAAHALAAPRVVVMGPERVAIGIISLVYSEPRFRGRGYAKRAIGVAEDILRKNGLSVCLLWSDVAALYRSLGYAQAGAEWFFAFPAGALRDLRCPGSIEVDAPSSGEWVALEALYQHHPLRCERRRGDLRRLASAPGCVVRVARENRVPVAYSVCGRGDDFPSIVHEWAGPPLAVAATLADHARDRETLGVLCPPHLEAHQRVFASLGGTQLQNDFAWMKLLDRTAAETAFGGVPGAGALPFYLWGFDSL